MTSTEPSSSGGSNWMKPVGFGCLALLVLAVIGIVVIKQNITAITAKIGERALVSAVEDLGLPEADEAAFVAEIRELSRAYREGEISEEEIAEIVERVSEDDALTAGAAITAFRSRALAASGLPDDEKAEADRICQRFTRAVVEERVDGRALERLRERAHDMRGRDMRDDEIRDLIESLAAEAESAGVPDEPYQIDLAGRFREVVAEAQAAAP